MGRNVTSMEALGFLGMGCMGLALAAGEAPAAGAQPVSDALRAAGWGVEVLDDGSLQLRPVVQSAQEAAPPQPQSPGVPAEPDVQPRVEQSQPAGTVDWSPLRSRGWRVERDADQATLLVPPGAAAPAASVDAVPRGSETSPDLESLLKGRGWRVERESDGTLVLSPHPASRSPSLPLTRAIGQVPAAVVQGRVALPVDTWEKARAVAASWLESVSDPALMLGKIRRIHGLYLISIVGAERPHPLRHQVSVGVDDGQVLVLR